MGKMLSDTPVSDIVLMTSGFIPSALEQTKARWHVIDIERQRQALEYLQTMDRWPVAICIGRTVDIGDDLDAWSMLGAIHEMMPGVPVIISTGLNAPQVIVDLVKNGAFDYVIEPADRSDEADVRRYCQDLVFALERAVSWRRVTLENERLRQDLLRQSFPGHLIGRTPEMMRVMDLISKVAPTSATVLITGESGTGKELAARSVHELSAGAHEGPFVALNCGSFSETLISSELFGYVKGAFTGADTDRPGLMRKARGGTLFLDEISTLPPKLQVMLLRVLEQRRARAVGATEDYEVDCRFVAAANRDLGEMVRRGEFREDLYYRLNVFNIHMPPLRDRLTDVPVLVEFFVQEISARYGKSLKGITPAALSLLESASWPGNVRQLRNALERAVIVAEDEVIDTADFDDRIRGLSPYGTDTPDRETEYESAMNEFERGLICRALSASDGNRSQAARILQINRTRLNYRIQKLGITS